MFGRLETWVAERLPGIVERAEAGQLTDDDLDVLAYFMSLQWLRTEFFRNRLQQMEAEAMKQIMKIASSFPSFPDEARKAAAQKGRTITDEDIEGMRRFIQAGEYDLRTNNASHLNFMGEKEIRGFHNLLLGKRWNILRAGGTNQFITSDNPVAEWTPRRTGFYGAAFMERRHYLPLTPSLLIETVNPPTLSLDEPPTKRLTYRSLSDDEVLMYDMVIANHGHEFAYAQTTNEFDQLLNQIEQPGEAIKMYVKNFLT